MANINKESMVGCTSVTRNNENCIVVYSPACHFNVTSFFHRTHKESHSSCADSEFVRKDSAELLNERKSYSFGMTGG